MFARARRRLGVALLIDEPHSSQIDGLRRALRDRSLTRIPPHITLVPPVNVKGGELVDALRILRAAAARGGRPLRLTLGPPATFLPANPVLYLPVGGDLPELRRLHEDTFRAPLERPLAWPWVPHVTLADDVDPVRMAAALDALDGYQVVVDVDRLVLLEERHTPDGRRWTPLADAGLRPETVVGRGGRAVQLVEGRVVGPDALALLQAVGHDEPVDGLERTAPDTTIVLSALVDGRLAGAGLAWRDDSGGHVAVVVDPDDRGTGVGRQILAHTEEAVRRADWTSPVLAAVGPAGFYAACSRWSRVTG
jgi:2'-5' RNA ligase